MHEQSIDKIGRYAIKRVDYTLRIFLLGYHSLRSFFLDQAQSVRSQISVVAAQIYFTGYQALPLITVLGLATGTVLIMQGLMNLSLVGGASMLGSFLVATVLREVTPLLTALIVVARSGTAVASELGNMRANREIDALISMGINPFSYIVFPRLAAGVICVLCLAFYFCLVALLGGFAVVKLVQDISSTFYFDSLLTSITREDIFVFALKNSFSGLIIFLVSCYQGLSVKRSPHEVPRATTDAVVHSILFVTIFNFLVTAIYYVFRLRSMGVI